MFILCTVIENTGDGNKEIIERINFANVAFYSPLAAHELAYSNHGFRTRLFMHTVEDWTVDIKESCKDIDRAVRLISGNVSGHVGLPIAPDDVVNRPKPLKPDYVIEDSKPTP